MPEGDSSSPDRTEAEGIVRTMLERDAFSRWLGVELRKAEPGEAVIQISVREDMLNGFGVCHGGVLFALADSALAFAATARGRVSLSVEAGMAFHEPVSKGDVLLAHAIEEAVSQKIATYTVRVTRAGGVVATFRGTVYRTRRDFSAAP